MSNDQVHVQALALGLDPGVDLLDWRMALSYSFVLDSQDFIVAYETDDLVAFGDLVRALRARARRCSTASDSPILLETHRPLEEILGRLGAA